jgi:hypothetical protein
LLTGFSVPPTFLYSYIIWIVTVLNMHKIFAARR